MTGSIITSGMSQAGSTLCFNLLRALYTAADATIHVYDPPNIHSIRDSIHQNTTTVVLTKQHDLPFSAELSVTNSGCYRTFKASHNIKVIRIQRDLRDAVASRLRKENSDRDLNVIKEYCDLNISWHRAWAHITDYDWVYERYKEKPIIVMRELQSVLGLSHSDELLRGVIHHSENLKHFYGDKEKCPLTGLADLSATDFDITTKMKKEQMTNNGIIGAYKDFFSEEEIAFMNSMYGDWLKKYGYMK